MRVSSKLERYRVVIGMSASEMGDDYGAFIVPGPCGQDLKIIASPGYMTDWEHVSVSCKNRTPNWTEMSFVKDLFWDPEEAVMQLHPPRSTWINNHPYCLHLFRPIKEMIPLPPSNTVGLKELNL